MVVRVVPDRPSFDELPEVLTIEEAARVLRISRGAAYALAGSGWTAAGGRAFPWCAWGAACGPPGRLVAAARRERRGQRARRPSKTFWRPSWPLPAASSRCRWRVGLNSTVVTKKVHDSQIDSK